MKCCKVKLKQIRLKEDKAGAQLGSQTEQKLFSHVAPLRFNSISKFRGIEIGKPFGGARGGATKHCLAPRVLSTPHFYQLSRRNWFLVSKR
jgi:hypothetical protein